MNVSLYRTFQLTNKVEMTEDPCDSMQLLMTPPTEDTGRRNVHHDGSNTIPYKIQFTIKQYIPEFQQCSGSNYYISGIYGMINYLNHKAFNQQNLD